MIDSEVPPGRDKSLSLAREDRREHTEVQVQLIESSSQPCRPGHGNAQPEAVIMNHDNSNSGFKLPVLSCGSGHCDSDSDAVTVTVTVTVGTVVRPGPGPSRADDIDAA
jgi:hypothetical protein